MEDNKDLTLPYLLVAFAGRMLANKESVTLSIEALQAQGYDTEVLVEMVAHYTTLPLSHREFAISTQGGSVTIRRLQPASQSVSPATPTVISHPKPSVPASAKQTGMTKPLVSLSELARQSAQVRKSSGDAAKK